MSTQTSLVTGVDFVALPTQNFDAAVAFYTDVLGLPCTARWARCPAPSSRPATSRSR